MVGQNVGPLDRVTRIIVGLLIVLYRYLARFSGVGWDLLVIAGALFVWEGILGYCLLYGLLGIGTLRRRRYSK